MNDRILKDSNRLSFFCGRGLWGLLRGFDLLLVFGLVSLISLNGLFRFVETLGAETHCKILGEIAKAQDLDAGSTRSLLKGAFKVIKESSHRVVIAAKDLRMGQKIMFVRLVPEFDEYETISQGEVIKVTDKLSLVSLDMSKNEKFPKPGDFAVVLGEPKVFSDPKTQKGTEGELEKPEQVAESEKGYAAFSFGLNQGDLQSSSSNRANSYKTINGFKYNGFRFTWVPEFLAHYGFEYSEFSGGVPVVDYYSRANPSTLKNTNLRLFYHSFLFEKKVQWALSIGTSLMDFFTDNGDEYILSSSSTGFGYGASLSYLFSSYLPTEFSGYLGKPQSLGAEVFMVPNLETKDNGGIRRGTVGTGSQLNLTLMYRHLFYWDFVPWVKRFFLEFRYQTNDLKINFSGETKNLSTNFYVIPQNGTYEEKYKVMTISLGWMMEDWLGQALKPRER